ncbi:RnfABCDGE type electron transport complex subunit C [Mediterraneibacter glycyrrhizinilyticus]|uniref:RnfABCDGE type electron transport complex subunit C n=1 Tax=Mediterraneibacter glycyrrhizinilyticus TaxID=342942 RepID=UPI001D0949F9|nr:RnfABCDGE type electron transport complex subunit C [Mediterraneibacter glycyrrhizinilyticus]MCB6310499.1 RnfABCDGE type electron transport complex subunit C [Lachnospiraceae bacterium 210521-DFI.1.109]MCB6428026.1 RnfABCDGE type electron transport complex subunit C [Mediterraneibacter glycyrrhizinilyticus]
MQRRGTQAFPGGVHPTDGSDKALSMDQAVKPYRPDIVTILSEQTFGGTCQFTVTPGESVIEGQLIGKPEAFLAAPLHASISGTVLDVKEVEQLGRKITACIIRRGSDHCQVSHTDTSIPHDTAAECAERKSVDYQTEISDIRSISREEILSGIRDGGLTGMGGAGFPTHKKYETDKPIDALLINGAECEPFLTCDYRLMLEDAYALINGVRLLLKGSGAKKAYLCLEDNKPKAAEHLTHILDEAKAKGLIATDETIELTVLPAKYPQGGERQLIQAVLKREVPMGQLPADAGVIVSNVGTAKAAADQILGNLPLTKRIITVTGLVAHPGNYLVPIGTSAKELLQFCGGVTAKENRIIAGGPMTGPCAASNWNGEDELFYITKSTSGILVLPDSAYEESPCIRCLGCADVCPAGLTPYQIEIAFLNEDHELCEELYASECIACGCCSYICPAKRQLAVRTRMARDLVKQRIRERAVKSS